MFRHSIELIFVAKLCDEGYNNLFSWDTENLPRVLEVGSVLPFTQHMQK
jgi:hypothetical protein